MPHGTEIVLQIGELAQHKSQRAVFKDSKENENNTWIRKHIIVHNMQQCPNEKSNTKYFPCDYLPGWLII